MPNSELIVSTAIAIVVGLISTALLFRRGRRLLGAFGATLTATIVLAAVLGAPSRFGAPIPANTKMSPVSQPVVSAPPIASWKPMSIVHGPGYAHIPRLSIPDFPASLRALSTSSAEISATHGLIGSTVIPGRASGFVARPAIVYLPPAALIPQPQLLPVIVALSGQSRGAGPADFVRSGHLKSMMDAIAAQHHGIAPIVVVPDQLGPASANPMCVDSKHFGRAATYIMRDVRDWILRHLPVAATRKQWTIAGFSEGGTCSIQFAAAHPDVFGSFVDVSGELAPANGSVQETIRLGFGGSTHAYVHATPEWIMNHHRYADEQAYFAVGALDHTYGPITRRLRADAQRAGMSTHYMVAPRLSHNWRVASTGFTWAFRSLTAWWGL